MYQLKQVSYCDTIIQFLFILLDLILCLIYFYFFRNLFLAVFNIRKNIFFFNDIFHVIKCLKFILVANNPLCQKKSMLVYLFSDKCVLYNF